MTNAWTEEIDRLKAENALLRKAVMLKGGKISAEAEAVVRLLTCFVDMGTRKMRARHLCERFLAEFPGHDELVSRIWREEFGEGWG